MFRPGRRLCEHTSSRGSRTRARDRLGFELDFRYEDFYVAVRRGATSIHLKCAPKTVADRALRAAEDHLDAYIVVEGVAALFAEVTARGTRVMSPLQLRPWFCNEF